MAYFACCWRVPLDVAEAIPSDDGSDEGMQALASAYGLMVNSFKETMVSQMKLSGDALDALQRMAAQMKPSEEFAGSVNKVVGPIVEPAVAPAVAAIKKTMGQLTEEQLRGVPASASAQCEQVEDDN